MSLRRSLSDETARELRMEQLLADNQRLEDKVRLLEAAQARSEAVVQVQAAIAANATLSEFLVAESRPHPSTGQRPPKRVRVSKAGHLKGVAPGALLTQAHIIAGIREAEMAEKEAAERKSAEKAAQQEAQKQTRALAAAEKKRQRAEEAKTAREAKRARPAASAAEGASDEGEASSLPAGG